jgi:3-hydroxyisobutyrate dehydrogenase-like beta-hydroxyacid dehydrogenase
MDERIDDGTVADGEREAITVLGLGAMGTALAGTLLARGHPTTVCNRTPERADALVAVGARRAAAVADAVAASSLTIACVVDDAAVHELLDRAGDAFRRGVLVNLTNGTPAQARRAAERAADLGVAGYVDGGIMAVPSMMGTPDALVLYSGSREAFAVHRHALESLGATRYLGADPGLASLYDLALLSGMYGMFAGALHAIALVGSERVPAASLTELLLPWLEAMTSGLPSLAEQVDTGDHSSESPLAMQAAALANIVDASRAQGISPELMLPIQRLVERAVAAGHGADDLSSLVGLVAGSGRTPVAVED